jgi:crossover junction endodeoxyribonuclease RuvC
VDAGVLRTDAKDSHADRLGAIHEMLNHLIGELQPDHFAIERAFVGVNISSALKLGEARGALISAAQRHSLTVSEITPAQVKRIVAGQGAASKESVALAMKTLLGFDRGRMPHDVTDAMAIALCHGLGMASAGLLAKATGKVRGR